MLSASAAVATTLTALLAALPAGTPEEPDGGDHWTPAPRCLTSTLRTEGQVQRLWVRNTCGAPRRYRVVLDRREDFPCVTQPPGSAPRAYEWRRPGTLRMLASC
ncbi:hypothetical protein [Bailinhaonella thermotolerans]|uniref:Secreted protein n=1 Tax=Bailinhaonella thermotolerans TaxID=1070861 RepID=A0A3A4B6Q2_9ACTN|nr:hypothetical protein [Bailinhaonella thermotolerans]RJL33194.1 hypothetical protein D5H75_10145 [Bailinhaonella thermotolerans]